MAPAAAVAIKLEPQAGASCAGHISPSTASGDRALLPLLPAVANKLRRFLLTVADALSAHSLGEVVPGNNILSCSALQPRAVVMGAALRLQSADPLKARLLVGLSMLTCKSLKASGRVPVPEPGTTAAEKYAQHMENFTFRMQGSLRYVAKADLRVWFLHPAAADEMCMLLLGHGMLKEASLVMSHVRPAHLHTMKHSWHGVLAALIASGDEPAAQRLIASAHSHSHSHANEVNGGLSEMWRLTARKAQKRLRDEEETAAAAAEAAGPAQGAAAGGAGGGPATTAAAAAAAVRGRSSRKQEAQASKHAHTIKMLRELVKKAEANAGPTLRAHAKKSPWSQAVQI